MELDNLVKWASKPKETTSICGSWLWKIGFGVLVIILVVIMVGYLLTRKPINHLPPAAPGEQRVFLDEAGRRVNAEDVTSGRFIVDSENVRPPPSVSTT